MQTMILVILPLLFTISTCSQYILFASFPAASHLTPQIEIAKKLQQRGYRVAIADIEEYEKYVAPHNLTYLSYGPCPHTQEQNAEWFEQIVSEPNQAKRMGKVMHIFAMYYRTTYTGLKKIVEMERPDFLVIDLMALGAIDLAVEKKIPYMVNAHYLEFMGFQETSYIPNGLVGFSKSEMSFANRFYSSINYPIQILLHFVPEYLRVNEERKKLGIEPYQNPFEKVNDKLVLVSSFFGFEYPRKLPPNVIFVGGLLPKYEEKHLTASEVELFKWLDETKEDEFVVYIAFGTVISVTEEQITKLIEGILKFSNSKIVIAIRKPVMDRFSIPKSHPRIRFENWVNQRRVLKHNKVKVFINHGGIQSIFESLDAGVPIISLPFFSDQFANAAKVYDSGIGFRLDPIKFTAEQVYHHVGKLITNNTEILRQVKRLDKINKLSGGASKAADYVEYAMQVGADHLVSLDEKMSFIVAYNYDVKAAAAGLFVLVCVLLYVMIRFVCNIFCKKGKSKHE